MKNGSLTAQIGFTYIGLLMLLAISGIAMAGAGLMWSQEAQREREKELLYIGNQYRQAIASYYQSSLGTKQYPEKLEELILDKRTPIIKRHIRKLYQDPMNLNHHDKDINEWGLVKQQGRIVGVYSQSDLAPIKNAGFDEKNKGFEEADTYQDWKFVSQLDNVATNPNQPADAVPQ